MIDFLHSSFQLRESHPPFGCMENYSRWLRVKRLKRQFISFNILNLFFFLIQSHQRSILVQFGMIEMDIICFYILEIVVHIKQTIFH